MALGPTRDHAWVVDWRPLRCLLGPLGRPLGGFSEACFLAVWGLLEVFWGPLGLLGASLGPLGASWGPPDGLGGHLGEKGSRCQFEFPLLGPSLGPSWWPLGCLASRLGAILGAYWAVLGGRETEKPSMKKQERNEDCSMGEHRSQTGPSPTIAPFWRPKGRLLVPSWSALGALLGAQWGCLGAIFGALEGFFTPSWDPLRSLGSLLEIILEDIDQRRGALD